MGIIKDWMPGVRDLILQMAAAWLLRLSTKGASWGVPAAVITELHDLADAAQAAIDLAVKSERTPVINAQIKAAFDRLKDKMREIKNRWFHKPPLTDEDFVALLLAEADEVPTYHGRPTTHGVIKAGPHGAHSVSITIEDAEGETRPKGEVFSNIYAGIMPPGGAALEAIARDKLLLDREPTTHKELVSIKRTQRGREVLNFAMEQAGSTLFLCVVYENRRGEAGPAGTITKVIIP